MLTCPLLPRKNPTSVQLRTLIITTALAIAAIAASACTGGASSEATPTAAATAAPTRAATGVPRTPTTAPTPEATAQATHTAPPPPTATTSSTFPLVIKFSRHPASDSDPSAVFDVPRMSPDSGVARYAIGQLLAGPTTAEAATGYFSTWTDFTYGAASDCGGDPFELTLTGATLTVRFCTTVTLLGAVADGQANTAMTETLLQFSTISRVNILNRANHCLFDLSGLDLCLAP